MTLRLGAYLLERLLVTDRASRHPSFLAGSGVRRVVGLLWIVGLLAWLAAVMFGLGAPLVALAHPDTRRRVGCETGSAGCRPPLAARDVPEPGKGDQRQQRSTRASRPVLLIASGHGAEVNANRTYRDAAGRRAELWTIPEAAHTGGLRSRPAEYERRTTAFLDRAL